jgi:predicted GIY-YIG superfamily endonuclease
MVPKLHHIVYVIELDDSVLGESKFVAANPNHDPDLPCIYVGQTGLTAKQRFENHRSGRKSSKFVRKYCVRLLPHLYEHLPTMTWEDSKAMEQKLAEELRDQGYAVWWG